MIKIKLVATSCIQVFLILILTKTVFAENSLPFNSDLESLNSECWQNRPNHGTWNLNGCDGFINIGSGYNIELNSNEKNHSGNHSLKVTYKQNEDYGAVDVKINDTDRIFTRFYDFYDKDFDFGFGVKSHRIRSFNDTSEINNFDIVMVTWGQATSGEFNYTGKNDSKYITIGANGGPTDWGSVEAEYLLDREKWHCIETEVKLNTPSLSDGYVRVWINGNKVLEKIGVNIRGNTNNKINMIMFGGWYSNSAGGQNPSPNPHSDSIRYIDDISIDSKRIGCSSINYNNKPNAPTGLRTINNS